MLALELCDASLNQCFLPIGDPEKYTGPMPSEMDSLLHMAKGLKHLHDNNIAHHDIKPHNVLIQNSPLSGRVLLKLSDFGLSKKTSNRGTFSISNFNGTCYWIASELLLLADNWNRHSDRVTQLIIIQFVAIQKVTFNHSSVLR